MNTVNRLSLVDLASIKPRDILKNFDTGASFLIYNIKRIDKDGLWADHGAMDGNKNWGLGFFSPDKYILIRKLTKQEAILNKIKYLDQRYESRNRQGEMS